jgi:hypothetical protein
LSTYLPKSIFLAPPGTDLGVKLLTHKKSNFGKHPMLRLYKKHNLASKLFLFYKETQVEIFFESVLGKSKCDCRCSHF